MKETIDETLKRWLRKWLGLVLIEVEQENTRRREQEIEERFKAATFELENTRQDLIQRMADLSVEIAERKQPAAPTPDKSKEVVSAGHVPFSMRRQRAQGRGTNMAAYVTPGKPTPKA